MKKKIHPCSSEASENDVRELKKILENHNKIMDNVQRVSDEASVQINKYRKLIKLQEKYKAYHAIQESIGKSNDFLHLSDEAFFSISNKIISSKEDKIYDNFSSVKM